MILHSPMEALALAVVEDAESVAKFMTAYLWDDAGGKEFQGARRNHCAAEGYEFGYVHPVFPQQVYDPGELVA